MERLRIGNEEDIRRIINYEHNRGYNRYNKEQIELKKYTIECFATVKDSVIVEAFDARSAIKVALREVEEEYGVDFDDFGVDSITEEEL